MARMNERAGELGMADTVFKNCNGLDEEGHVTSAYDVALMSRALLRFEKIRDYTLTWMDSVRNGETQLVNTNKLIRSYQGITGLKTGTTSQAGSCIAATAERDGMELIAVVLGADSTDYRFQDAAALLDYGFAGWEVARPQPPQLGEVPWPGAWSRPSPPRWGTCPPSWWRRARGSRWRRRSPGSRTSPPHHPGPDHRPHYLPPGGGAPGGGGHHRRGGGGGRHLFCRLPQPVAGGPHLVLGPCFGKSGRTHESGLANSANLL